jgi:LAT3 family solute carrier family 43 protein 3
MTNSNEQPVPNNNATAITNTTITDTAITDTTTLNDKNNHKLFVLYTFSFIVVSLSSGLVYGYPHLRNNLLRNGSTLTESQLGIVYTVGTWTVQGGRFFSGIARDKYGTRNIASLCLLSAMCGCIGLAFSDVNNVLSLSISFFLVGLGSGGQLCLQPVASLFQLKWQGTVLASLSGAFQISGLVFLVLIQITENRMKSYGFFALILGVFVLCSIYLLPKDKFVTMENNDDNDDSNNHNNKSGGEKLKHYDTVSTNDKENAPSSTIIQRVVVEDDDQNNSGNNYNNTIEGDEHDNDKNEKIAIKAINLMKSKEYILLITWFTIMLIPMQYYIGTIGFQLERKGDTNGTYTNLFSIVYASAAFVSPFIGKIADLAGVGMTQTIATLFSSASLLILIIVLKNDDDTNNDDTDYGLNIALNLNIQLVGMIFYGIGRLSVFGMFFTNIGKRFGYDHYGTLAGFGLLISAIFSLLQYPLIDAAARGNEYIVNLTCGCCMVGFGVPYCIWLGIKEKREKERGGCIVVASAETQV